MGSVAICSVEVASPQDMDAQLLLGFDERATVWLNGEQIFEPTRRKIASLDEFAIPVRLKRGANLLVIRVEDKRLAWGFLARLADLEGWAILGLTVQPRRLAPSELKAKTDNLK